MEMIKTEDMSLVAHDWLSCFSWKVDSPKSMEEQRAEQLKSCFVNGSLPSCFIEGNEAWVNGQKKSVVGLKNNCNRLEIIIRGREYPVSDELDYMGRGGVHYKVYAKIDKIREKVNSLIWKYIRGDITSLILEARYNNLVLKASQLLEIQRLNDKFEEENNFLKEENERLKLSIKKLRKLAYRK